MLMVCCRDKSFHMHGVDFLSFIEDSDVEQEEEKHPVIIPRSWNLINTLKATEGFRNWFNLV